MTTSLPPPPLSPFALEGEYIIPILNNIRTRPISWTSFTKAGYLTPENASALKDLTSLHHQEESKVRGKAIAGDPQLYAKVLIESLDLLVNSNGLKVDGETDLFSILLTLLYDGISTPAAGPFTSALITTYKDKSINIIGTLLKKFQADFENEENQIIAIIAAYILTVILTTAWESIDHSVSHPLVENLFAFVHDKLLANDTQLKFIALQLLKELLSIKEFKILYIKSSDFETHYASVLELLKNNGKLDLQMRYLTIYYLWVLTFEKEPVKLLLETPAHANIIPILFQIANDAVKEKVVRLSIAVLLNILRATSNSPQVVKKYLLLNGLNIMQNLLARKWSDEDLRLDLEDLHATLADSVKSLTTFDEYENELSTKVLHWSPCHKNQEFWLDNVDKFKENNWKIVRQLTDLLTADPGSEKQLYLNQAVVCHDIAMIMKLSPEVSKVLASTGAKTKIMTLMNSPDSNVKFEALRTTQLLVANLL